MTGVDDVIRQLDAVADPSRLQGMARVGIEVDHAKGVSVPQIRRIARGVGRNDELARALWDTGVHEARMVAALVVDPGSLSMRQMRTWASEIDSWDLGDLMADTFCSTRQADRLIEEWSRARHGFTKRCAFAMIARLAVGAKDRPDDDFVAWLPLIRAAATDERNEVKKAVSWALRQTGKRNRTLHTEAVREARELLEIGSRSATWIARDTLRELGGPETVARIPP